MDRSKRESMVLRIHCPQHRVEAQQHDRVGLLSIQCSGGFLGRSEIVPC